MTGSPLELALVLLLPTAVFLSLSHFVGQFLG